jgi:hypothetical protein
VTRRPFCYAPAFSSNGAPLIRAYISRKRRARPGPTLKGRPAAGYRAGRFSFSGVRCRPAAARNDGGRCASRPIPLTGAGQTARFLRPQTHRGRAGGGATDLAPALGVKPAHAETRWSGRGSIAQCAQANLGGAGADGRGQSPPAGRLRAIGVVSTKGLAKEKRAAKKPPSSNRGNVMSVLRNAAGREMFPAPTGRSTGLD